MENGVFGLFARGAVFRPNNEGVATEIRLIPPAGLVA